MQALNGSIRLCTWHRLLIGNVISSMNKEGQHLCLQLADSVEKVRAWIRVPATPAWWAWHNFSFLNDGGR
jgi:hypothetical protein